MKQFIFTGLLFFIFIGLAPAQIIRGPGKGPVKNGASASTKGPYVLSISRQNPLASATTAKTVTCRVTFSEKVSGVNYTDFMVTTLSGSVKGSVASTIVTGGGSDKVYDVTVTSITGTGVIRLDLKSSGTGIKNSKNVDISGGFNTGQTYTIQEAAPTLVSVAIASDNVNASLAKPGNIITLKFTASTAISLPVVTIATHAASVTAGLSNSFTASYTMAGSDAGGTVPFTINFSTVAGTPGTRVTATSNGTAVVFDKTAPSVNSIVRQTPLTAETGASSVVFRATFNEKVSGVNAGSFAVTVLSGNVTGTIGAVATVGTTGTVYDITVSAISGEGDIRLDLRSAGTGISDAAGNAIATGFTTGELYSIVHSKPVLTSVSIASGNAIPGIAKPGNMVTLKFTASQAVNTPVVTIASHAASVMAGADNSFIAGYTMTSSDVNGVIPFTIDFTNTLGTAGTRVTATTNGSSVIFDKTAPVIISINRQVPLTESTNAVAVVYRVTFSEKVTGVNDPDFSVATVTGNASGILSPGAVTAVGTAGTVYDVTVSAVSGSGSLRLNLKPTGHGIADVAGNLLGGGFSSGQAYTNVPGFASLTSLAPVDLSQPTKDKPQSKVWKYAGQWWCVLSATAGTKVYRLDGTTWTDILTLHAKSSKPDCRVVNDLVHVLLYKGALNNSLLYSLKYDPVNNVYALWNARPAGTNIVFPANSETSTMLVDGNGRMWVASDGISDMTVWWADAPYTSFSAPLTLATGAKDDDICALVDMAPLNKIGLFWSDQTTKRFGFRTHANGADPSVWSADEQPASRFANDTAGFGFADDHMNLATAGDGTVYCAAKTSYNLNGFQKLILLVRRPAGTWDSAYTVTTNPEGTQPVVLLNEAKRRIRMIYATVENGGDIVYRECSMDNIAISAPITLISNPGDIYDYTTSTHQNHTADIVILATRLNTAPQQAVGVIASDDGAPVLKTMMAANTVSRRNEKINNDSAATVLSVYPNPMGAGGTIRFRLPYSSNYELSIYNSGGMKQSVIKKGRASAGADNTVNFERGNTPAGFYTIRLQTDKGDQNIKVIINK